LERMVRCRCQESRVEATDPSLPPIRMRPAKTAGPRRAPRVRLPKFVGAYFFFDAFLLLFLEDFAAAFLVAISLTTFHAVRDLPVAPTWQTTAGLLRPT